MKSGKQRVWSKKGSWEKIRKLFWNHIQNQLKEENASVPFEHEPTDLQNIYRALVLLHDDIEKLKVRK